jgi:hypothetical protein
MLPIIKGLAVLALMTFVTYLIIKKVVRSLLVLPIAVSEVNANEDILLNNEFKPRERQTGKSLLSLVE